MRRKGYTIKLMGEDGACLFRAVADQLYGDQVIFLNIIGQILFDRIYNNILIFLIFIQDMHRRVRSQCMNYIVSIFILKNVRFYFFT